MILLRNNEIHEVAGGDCFCNCMLNLNPNGGFSFDAGQNKMEYKCLGTSNDSVACREWCSSEKMIYVSCQETYGRTDPSVWSQQEYDDGAGCQGI